VLTAGAGSRDASALPGRLQWRLGLDGAAIVLHARQACCINGEMSLRVVPGLARLRVELPGAGPNSGPIGQWPASWLMGLGTPWNTVQPSGTLQLSSPGLVLEQVQGRWRFSGSAQLDLGQFASRLSTLDALGSYRLTISGDAARGDATTLALSTLEGALQLSGSGQFTASKLRFNGQADAAPGAEPALANLLNIIGRRRGASSIISIG
jgi:general secretion pathway protein N